MRAALLGVAVLTLAGCGGSGSTSATDGTNVTLVPQASPTSSPGDLNPSPGPNSMGGTINVTGTSKSAPPVYVALLQGSTLVGRRTVAAGGSYTFPSMANGSYHIVVSGEGLRPQSDIFNMVNGSKIRANYTLSAKGSKPSNSEAQGIFAQGLRLMRGLTGFRAIPLGAQAAFDFNRRNNFVKTSAKSANLSQANVIAIPVRGAQNVAVDRTGTAWVSTNDTITVPPPAPTPTSVGVVQINTQGQVVGQFATAAAANSGGGAIGVDNALDVALFNLALNSYTLLPRGQTNLSTATVTGTDVSVTGIVNQQVPGNTATSRLILAGDVNGAPRLAFLSGAGVATQVTLPAGVAVNLAVLGAYSDPTDQTIYLAGHQTTLNGPAHLYHLSADGTTLLEDINLGNFTLFGIQNLTRDTSGNFWMGATTNLVKVSGAVGNRTVTVIPAKHQDATAFGFLNGIAADGAGHVWAADNNKNNITEFDLNGNALLTLNTGPAPQSVAVDSNNNVWIACAGQLGQPGNAVVDEVVVGGAVPPNTTTQVYVSPNGITETVTPGPGQSALQRAFPGATYVDNVLIAPTVQLPGSDTISTQVTAVTVSGPTVTYQSPQYQTGTYTTDGTSTDARTGDALNYRSIMAANGTGTFTATSPASSINVTYKPSPQGGGKILMTSTVSENSNLLNTMQIVTYTVTATYAADGSVTDFLVTTNSSDIGLRGSITVNGRFLAEIFNVDLPTVRLSAAQNGGTLTVISSLIKLLEQSIPTATPTGQNVATMFQALVGTGGSMYAPGATPGYTTLSVTNPDGSQADVGVPNGLTAQPSGSTDPNAATPPSQTVGGTDANGQNVPPNQGVTPEIDFGGQASGEISGASGGVGTLDKGGPIR